MYLEWTSTDQDREGIIRWCRRRSVEEDGNVVAVVEKILLARSVREIDRCLQCILLLLLSLELLLISLDLLHSEELFSLHLVQFCHDVTESVLDARNDNLLDGVDSPIGDLDGLVEGDEARLEGRQLHQQLDRLIVVLLQLGDIGPSLAQSRQIVRVRPVRVRVEHRQEHSYNVLLLHPHSVLGVRHVLYDGVREISGGELGLGQRECRLLHHLTHQHLGLDDLPEDITEPHVECVCLLLQQRVSLLSSLQTRLHHRLRHARRKHGNTILAASRHG
ncbi:hypothetical protein PENTCL1PPCAC_10605 [Pristionchus entomophagus]|uniref:Ribosomal protein n=1 Tax=Pristionchus entomophagus TaxID=358040 RepID=A0AAV5SZ24_9BILA|nr:hypothetical protein PENTCL1PPCAC_10605 [Pristionchus entomophagus]